jgi:hypothetical protein
MQQDSAWGRLMVGRTWRTCCYVVAWAVQDSMEKTVCVLYFTSPTNCNMLDYSFALLIVSSWYARAVQYRQVVRHGRL